ncbi:hypothetical protein EX895_005900 [Sporisorium graminicola]|uniref:Uncharacterized protein n=1 Tax=Sporisorium graminicola TaxID=280036 RepID=A0A4U7KKY6_9BASI|nr:hypothetical protein EX895_005900 [Sporisorium graminicola]TKY84820.1 hypothetical protein EX895_005900 [Sporisorium graminicola]
MSTTPSPSKRPRIPTSSAVASATASPFPGAGAGTGRPSHGGPRSVGPTGTSAHPSVGPMPIVGLGMSLMDTYSPAPGTVDSYGMTGFTPYSTTSPAYIAGAASAASPISAALAHGSRILSGIQAGSPFYNNGSTPMIPQQARYAPGMMQPTPSQLQQHQLLAAQQAQQPRPPSVPQHGSPEYLKLALQHLQTTLLTRLESDAEAFFDAADSAVASTADSRLVAQKAASFQLAMDNVLAYLEKNGLASIPLLPLPESNSTDTKDTAPQSTESPKDAASTTIQDAAPAVPASTSAEASPPSLQTEITLLQHQAKDLFDRRQRLKESASIVGGILDS